MLALNIMSISYVKEEKDKIYPWKVIDEGRLRERLGGKFCAFLKQYQPNLIIYITPTKIILSKLFICASYVWIIFVCDVKRIFI